MPLTSKGSEIMGSMKEQYGEKKGEQVFYASKQKGTISGVDQTADATDVAPTADATLNWSGGEHALMPGGPGDHPFTPEQSQVSGVEGQSGMNRSNSALSGVDAIMDWQDQY